MKMPRRRSGPGARPTLGVDMPSIDLHHADESVTLWHGDCLDVLRELADCSVDSIVTDLAAGTAAEHLVCANLLMLGFNAFMTDQNCAYDVAVDIAGRLVRIQVKATRKLRPIPQRMVSTPGYMWHV